MNTREEPASTSTSEQTITTTSVEISEENTGGKTCRSKRVVCVIEKLNMVFLVFFVCYLSWTIPANYGLFTSNGSGVDVNGTMGNSKGQNEEANSTGRKPDDSFTNFTDFYTRTVQQFNDPHTGRQYPFKRRRKQKLKNGRKPVLNPSVLDTENNEIIVDSKSEKHKNKRNKNRNRNTKRRKSRRKQKKINFDNVLEPTTIRHIIETVAKEELAKGGNWNTHKGNGAPRVTLSVGDNSVIDQTQHSIRKNNKKGNGRRKIPPSGGKNRGEGKWSWSEWGPCSTTCGVGQKERNRRCGMACKEVESMVCFMPSCEGNGKQESGKKHVSSFYLWENENFVPKPPGKDYIDPEVDNCGTWMDCNREVITEYFDKTDLPSCPCTYPLHLSYNEKVWDKQKKQHYLWLDASGADEALAVYKPAAQYCIRSKLVPGTDTLAAQHCCYDSATRLITRGKSAGTPNLISPEISPELHQKVDISPWIICKGDWTRYNEIIPPNNVQECEDNPRNKEFLRQVKLAKNF